MNVGWKRFFCNCNKLKPQIMLSRYDNRLLDKAHMDKDKINSLLKLLVFQ